MKIKNKTHWRSDQLKAIIMRVAEDELESSQRKRLVVWIGYNRQVDRGWCSGHAPIGTAKYSSGNINITVNVPSQKIDHVDFAHVTAHEIAHTRGIKHAQMRDNPLYRRVGCWREHYAWAETMPLEKKETKAKAKPDVQLTRYQRVLDLQKKWQTKLKRAQTALKKLRQKQRYYERVLIVAEKLPKDK